MTTQISLRSITDANRDAILALKVTPQQHCWIASNEVSLRQAAENAEACPEYFGIYANEQPVGFLMLGCFSLNEEERPDWFVWRIMIDATYQRRGYGRAAMQQVIEHVRTKPDCRELRISFEPANHPARALYTSLGFIDHDEIHYGEVLLRMPIRDDST